MMHTNMLQSIRAHIEAQYYMSALLLSLGNLILAVESLSGYLEPT